MKTLACSLAVLLFASTVSAGRVFKVEDMQALSRVGGVRISPDGTSVAFTVTRSDLAKNRMVTNIWLMPAAGGEPRQLTVAERGSNTALRWSPDSRYLYFVSNRVDNKRQI